AGGYHSVIEDEPGGKTVIPLVVIGRKGLFKMRPRAGVIALKPASYAIDVKCPARRRRSGRVPGITQGKHRHLAHRREVGANKASHPHAVIGREPRDGVFDPSGKLAGARKRGNRLWLAVPSTMKWWMTVRGLQPQPEEPLGRTIGESLGWAARLSQMRDLLVIGGSVQPPVPRLDPPFDGNFAEPRLREMMGDDFRLGLGRCLESVAQGLGNPQVQHLAAALEHVLIGR